MRTTLHATIEDEQGWHLYPRNNRNLLNSAERGGKVAGGIIGKRNTARALSDMLVTRGDGSQYFVPRHKPRAKRADVASIIIGTPLDYVVSYKRPPRRTLSDVASFLLARGWDKESITRVLNVHRARPDYGTTVELVQGDSWNNKG